MKKIYFLYITVISSICMQSAHAGFVIPENFPVDAKDFACSYYSEICKIYPADSSTSGGSSDKKYFVQNDNGNSWLINYQTKVEFIGGAEPLKTESWLLAPQAISRSEENVFSILTPYVGQKPFSMTFDAALQGAGELHALDLAGFDSAGLSHSYLDDKYLNNSINADYYDLFVCVECGVDFEFNLIGLRYIDSDGFKAYAEPFVDKRNNPLLYSFNSFSYAVPIDDYGEKVFVQTVPLPGAIWLFGTCFLSCFMTAAVKKQNRK